MECDLIVNDIEAETPTQKSAKKCIYLQLFKCCWANGSVFDDDLEKHKLTSEKSDKLYCGHDAKN